MKPATEQNATRDVMRWIEGFVEKPHPALGGFPPCPYARQARLKDQVVLHVANKAERDLYLARACEDILDRELSVSLLIFPLAENWGVEEAEQWVMELRRTGRSRDLYFLWDHPSDPQLVNGVVMNQGQHFIVFVQRLSKLAGATLELRDAGYYNSWGDEAVAVVLGSRFE